MSQVVKIRPANSLIFISDEDGGTAPVPVRGAMVWSTPYCVAVVCYPEQDGPTEVTLGDGPQLDPGTQPLFDGSFRYGSVIVSTVDQQQILQMRTRQPVIRLRVWTNHARWPDKVIVGVA